jgi:predicted enzyme related to lactoylglutathione lyase
MAIDHIQIISVPVADVDRARAFYLDVLEWELVMDVPYGDKRWVEVAPRHGQTSFVLVTWFPEMPPGSMQGIVLDTDDIDRCFADLSARGVEFHAPIEDGPFSRITSFSDPDGNGLVLHQLYERRDRRKTPLAATPAI